MRIPRLYLPTEFTPNTVLELSKEQAHYVLTVLRLKNQHPVELFNGQGQQADAQIDVTGKRSANCLLQTVSSPNTESPLFTRLLQGISRGDRMDYSIQKAVELGVSQIQPLFTDRCEVKLKSDKIEKRRAQWQAIAISACEQSGRNVVPEILAPVTLAEWYAQHKTNTGLNLVLDPVAEHGLKDLTQPEASVPIQLLIGPEGGLSDEEIQTAQANGFTGVQLGPRVLRTETAGVTVLAALQTLWGDF